MPAEVTVVTGPARSGKTARLLAMVGVELSAARQRGELGTALWLTPNFRVVDSIRQRLLAAVRPATLGLSIRTFDQFAEALLGGAITAGRPLSALQKRRLLESILRELRAAGKLRFFESLADRPSLVETLGRTIAELKRRCISPAAFLKRAQRATASERDGEIALIYAEYQRQLDDHRLYDADSRLALASELIRRGVLGAYADLRLIVVDELTTFTPAQLGMLAAWGERAEQIAISLTLDEASDRPELFATTCATLAELRERFGKLQVEELSREGESRAHSSELLHLQRCLFIDPRKLAAVRKDQSMGGRGSCRAKTWTGFGTSIARQEPRPPFSDSHLAAAPRADAIEIIAAASAQDEALQVARRVKQMLIDGVAASDILVSARSLAELGPRIREAFAQFGIPLAIEGWRLMGEEPLLRALMTLLELDAGNWPFRKLVRLLSNRRVAAFDRSGARGAAEWVVRELQFAAGREPLLKAVRKLADAKENETPEGYRRQQAATLSVPLLQELATALDDLPVEASPLDWYSALQSLWKRLGIVAESTDSLPVLRQALRAAEQLAAWQGQPPPTLDRSEILKLLRDIASHEKLPEAIDETGCVRVMSAPTARLLDANHLFVMDLVEQSFPPPEPVGELYNDRELDALAGRRGGQDERPDLSSSEMLLFYELVSRARERLVFSYSALDEKAQPQFASPYLQDVERIFSGAIQRTDPSDSLRAVPTGPPASDADWRLQAVDHALHGSLPLLAGLASEARTATTARSLLAGLEATHHRTHGESFGPFEGVFSPGPAHSKLAKRFGGEHLWSPSQLESYANCPFKFFMEQVCHFDPPGELLLETDPMRKGTLVHEALAILHRRLRDRIDDSTAVSHLGADTLREEYLAAVDEARKELPAEGVIGALADLEQEDIRRWAAAYAMQHAAYDKQWADWEKPLVPRHFEVRFGPARGSTSGEDERSTDEPFVLRVGDEELQFTGRIDRIDVGHMNGQMVISIVDYKSGRTVKYETKDVQAGKQLQLVLYAMAAEQHLFRGENALAVRAGYWKLADEKLETSRTKRWIAFQNIEDGQFVPNQEWSTTWEKASAGIGDIVRGIRQGQFPMVNSNSECTSKCDFRTVCRVAVARSLDKQWPPADSPSNETSRRDAENAVKGNIES